MRSGLGGIKVLHLALDEKLILVMPLISLNFVSMSVIAHQRFHAD